MWDCALIAAWRLNHYKDFNGNNSMTFNAGTVAAPSIVGGTALEAGASAATTDELAAEAAEHAMGGTGDEGRCNS
jgi:hypothetical protein